MSQNPFETGQRKVIPAVLAYLRCGDEVLMIHRSGRKDGKPDFHKGRWNGLGGKLEADESPLAAACREIQEEAGLRISKDRFRAVGFLLFPNFKPQKKEDWQVTVFTAELKKEEKSLVQGESAEGQLVWVSEKQVMGLNLWPGDQLFIPDVLRGNPFCGTIWYREGEVDQHELMNILGASGR